MSNLDKTGKKLIDSIRKTKKGPATAAVKSATKKTTAREATKPNKSPVTSKSKSEAAAIKAKSVKVKSQPRKKTTPFTDIPFQDGSQVWPD